MGENIAAAADTAMEAYGMLPGDVALARQALTLALRAEQYDRIKAAYEAAPAAVQANGRVAMLYAIALLRTGLLSEAEAVLLRDGGLAVTDIREGEITLTELYIELAQAKAAQNGQTLGTDQVDVPRQFDFRMFVPKKK